jgi:hypothetical protein
MARERLGELLIRAGHLDEVGLQRALNEQQRWGGHLGRYLVDLGLITEETLVRALSTQLKVPAVALDPPRLSVSVGQLIPKEICERHSLVCFHADAKKKFLDVAMSDPSNLDAIDEVRVATHYNIRPHIAAQSAIDKAISIVFYGGVPLGDAMDLTPISTLTVDPGKREPFKRPPASPPPSPPVDAAPPGQQRWSPGVTPMSGSPAVEVKVTAGAKSDPAISRPAEPSIVLPPPAIEESFHITMDVPALDKKTLAKAQPGLEERVAMLEAISARDSAILQKLLEGMVRRGLFSRDEILRLITGV